MKAYRLCLAFALSALFVSCVSAYAEDKMSVQIKSAKLRADASHLGRSLSTLAYGDQVNVISEDAGWYKIKTVKGLEGFLHRTALTTKKIVFRSSTPGSVQAEEADLLLAGKGFNKEAEQDIASKDPSLNFAAVDRLERRKVEDNELAEFMRAGGLHVAPTE